MKKRKIYLTKYGLIITILLLVKYLKSMNKIVLISMTSQRAKLAENWYEVL